MLSSNYKEIKSLKETLDICDQKSVENLRRMEDFKKKLASEVQNKKDLKYQLEESKTDLKNATRELDL